MANELNGPNDLNDLNGFNDPNDPNELNDLNDPTFRTERRKVKEFNYVPENDLRESKTLSNSEIENNVPGNLSFIDLMTYLLNDPRCFEP